MAKREDLERAHEEFAKLHQQVQAMAGEMQTATTQQKHPSPLQAALDQETIRQLRQKVEQLSHENARLRESSGIPTRCAQCGKDTLVTDMMRTADGLLICSHCAYWD